MKTRLLAAICVILVGAGYLVAVAEHSGAATARFEAEALSPPGSCWFTYSYSRLSGGQGRYCYGPGAPLSWKVVVPSGQEAVVRLFGYADEVARGFRARTDGAAWSQGTLSGASTSSLIFYTSPSLGAGSHTIDLEYVSSAGSFTFDYYEVETTGAVTAPPTTTTTVPPPPTTDTTAPPPASACNIKPADGQAAITAAIKGCPDGSTVVFPAGKNYRQADKIVVERRRNLVIDGNGSTFTSSAANDTTLRLDQAMPNWVVVEGVNVTLKNMKIQGNLPRGPRGILNGNQYNAGVIVYGGNGVFITDVSVYSVFGEFVVSNPSGFYYGGGAHDGQVPTNVRIIRLRGEHAARQCVAVTAAQGFWLEDSTLSDCYQNGVDVEPDVAGVPLRDVHILRNTVSAYYFSAFTVPTAYRSGDVDGVEIRGNRTLSSSDTCYPAVLAGGVQGNAFVIDNVVVADNTLKTLYDGVVARYVGSGRVTGNAVTITVSPNYCGPPRGEVVRLVNSPNVTVHSNTAEGY